MALKYYLYMSLCHFPSSNMFIYSFVDFWTTEYIQIFRNSWKYEYFHIFALKIILILACIRLITNKNLGIIYASKKHPVYKFMLLTVSVSLFPKLLQSVMSMNIQIFEWNGPWILFVMVFEQFPEYKYIWIFYR